MHEYDFTEWGYQKIEERVNDLEEHLGIPGRSPERLAQIERELGHLVFELDQRLAEYND